MKNKAFTLIEIMVVCVVIVILATISIPTYQTIVEKAHATTCETNLNILKSALDVYIMEHDTMPASLSRIPSEYIDDAYAKLLGQKGSWRIKLARFILDLNKKNFAYAALIDTLGGGNIRIITCPNDSTSPEAGGVSYGINNSLAGMKYRDYKNLSGDILLIGDCETAAFTNASDLSSRHKHVFTQIDYAKAIVKNGEVKEEKKEKKDKKRDEEVMHKPSTSTPPSSTSASQTAPEPPIYEPESPSSAYETPGKGYEPPKKIDEPPGLDEKITAPENEPGDTAGYISGKKYKSPNRKYKTSDKGYEPPQKIGEPSGLKEKIVAPNDTTGSISSKKYESPSKEYIADTSIKSKTSAQEYKSSVEKKPLSGKQGERRE